MHTVWKDTENLFIQQEDIQTAQYIPIIMLNICALSCFVVIFVSVNLPISFRVTSLALGQSYNCPSVSEVTLDMGQ